MRSRYTAAPCFPADRCPRSPMRAHNSPIRAPSPIPAPAHRWEPQLTDPRSSSHAFLQCRLPQHPGGRYVIIPTTDKPGETTNFFMRIFMDASAHVKLLTKDRPVLPWYKNLYINQHPFMITRLKVIGIIKLEAPQLFRSKWDELSLLLLYYCHNKMLCFG